MKNRVITLVILIGIILTGIIGCSIEGVQASRMADEEKLAAHNNGDHRYCEGTSIDYNHYVGSDRCVAVSCLVGGMYATHYYYYD